MRARCNSRKWKYVEATDAGTGQVVPLYNPRTQKWTEHFRWSEVDSTQIEAISAVGRVTMVVLDLNSNQHLVIRSLNRILHLHPPAADAGIVRLSGTVSRLAGILGRGGRG